MTLVIGVISVELSRSERGVACTTEVILSLCLKSRTRQAQASGAALSLK